MQNALYNEPIKIHLHKHTLYNEPVKFHLHTILCTYQNSFTQNTLYNELVKFPICKTQTMNLSNSIYAKHKQNISYTMFLSKPISKAKYINQYKNQHAKK